MYANAKKATLFAAELTFLGRVIKAGRTVALDPAYVAGVVAWPRPGPPVRSAPSWACSRGAAVPYRTSRRRSCRSAHFCSASAQVDAKTQAAIAIMVHQVLLPKGLQEEALRDAHDRAGHLGMVKTYQRPRSTYYWSTYYWPGSRAAVDDYVKTCDGYQRSKTRARTIRPGHYRHRQVSNLLQTISVDILEFSIPSEG
jgi:hypothetical protein